MWLFYQITMIIILLLTTLSSVSPQFTVSSKSHLSRASSWRCGFFLVDARPRNGRQPAATFFIVQKHYPAQCPTKTFLKNARGWKKECNTQGEDWARKWDPEKGSGRGKNGDKVCKIAQKEMGGDIPNEEFPLGIQVKPAIKYRVVINTGYRWGHSITSVGRRPGMIQSTGGGTRYAAR